MVTKILQSLLSVIAIFISVSSQCFVSAFADEVLDVSNSEIKNQSLVLGHKNPDTDSIVASFAYAHILNARGIPALAVAQGNPNPETKIVLDKFNLPTPKIISSVADKDVYLVDYSDLEQAPFDILKANVRGIVDHHKLGNITTNTPPECWIQPYGSVNTVMKMVADYYNVKLSPNLAGAMLSAILSDTVIFKSPTTTEFDRVVANELAKIAGVSDIQTLGMEIFRAKTDLNATPRELIMRDFKDFTIGGKKIGIGQMELISSDLVSSELKKSLIDELAVVKSEGRHSALFFITDITVEGSELLIVSDEENRVLKSFGAVKTEKIWLPGIMSRKKQIVPALQTEFK